jgi:uncharacterized protein YndB with AHSA1/START domain
MADAPSAPHEFTITRVFDAPRELVFRAMTDPEQLTRWFGPRGLSTPRSTIDVDLRPGGQWRATMVVDADGTEYPTGGVYREVVEPERLVFTWVEPGAADPHRTALISISLADLGGKTEMTFHQAGPADADSEVRAGMHDGWSQTLDKLAESLVAH